MSKWYVYNTIIPHHLLIPPSLPLFSLPLSTPPQPINRNCIYTPSQLESKPRSRIIKTINWKHGISEEESIQRTVVSRSPFYGRAEGGRRWWMKRTLLPPAHCCHHPSHHRLPSHRRSSPPIYPPSSPQSLVHTQHPPSFPESKTCRTQISTPGSFSLIWSSSLLLFRLLRGDFIYLLAVVCEVCDIPSIPRARVKRMDQGRGWLSCPE